MHLHQPKQLTPNWLYHSYDPKPAKYDAPSTTDLGEASLLGQQSQCQNCDHSKQAVHQELQLRVVCLQVGGPPLIEQADLLGKAFGVAALLLKLGPFGVGNVVGADCLVQSFVGRRLTSPSGF